MPAGYRWSKIVLAARDRSTHKNVPEKTESETVLPFNDILVYGNIVINKKKYNKQHIIPLEEVKLESLEDDASYQNGWLIRTASKSFAVYAATATEKQEWMAHINKCIDDLLRKSGKKAVEVHAAVWVPDGEASVCMHCKETQFTLINRRHHCRKCGAVVCGPCSNKRFVLPNQSAKPLRVCTHCYDLLSSGTQETSRRYDSSPDDNSDDEDEKSKNNSHDEVTFYLCLSR
ncbi:pleckstrin y domain-containing family f member 2-related [Holotrichia oblita]|uniref:Pleckstrin y domain-containing family f member 2-related n=1 Tax=Holotrichia oblita TaxID=644536 RepID=A0ACB9TJF8_HOLOL|nr:pleckstrin y domain-containing family f member 2-related [Holotrichia oblita]